MFKSKKRLLLAASALGAVGATATLVAGVTFGFFSATTPSQTSTFTAGNVTLSQGATDTCTVTSTSGTVTAGTNGSSVADIVPGDSGTCTDTVTYTGSAPAYLGVDLAIASTAAGNGPAAYTGAGATPADDCTPGSAGGLYDGSACGLQVKVTDSNATTFMSGTTWNGTAASGVSPSVSDLLVNTTPDNAGTSVTFTVAYSLPVGAPNAYQNAGSSITLSVHAVQSGNNGSASACTAGDTCAGITGWS